MEFATCNHNIMMRYSRSHVTMTFVITTYTRRPQLLLEDIDQFVSLHQWWDPPKACPRFGNGRI